MSQSNERGPRFDRSGHLAVVLPNLGGGGAERVVVNLLKGFVAAGLRVDLLLVRASGPLLGEVPSNVRIHELNGGRIIASLPRLVRYLRREQPDALLSHLDTMNIVTLIARRVARVDTRTVVTTHSTVSMYMRTGTWRQRTAMILARVVYRWADAVVGVSRGVVDDFDGRIGTGRVQMEVVYNPIVSRCLLEQRELPKDTTRIPESLLGRGRGGLTILSAGRLSPEKNHALLVDAFAALASRNSDLQLIILGEGPERPRLEAKISMLGLSDRVSLPGFVKDPIPYFQKASVFVLSSNWEGLPTVLIEALAHGCPIVSTRCPTGPEEILEGGTYGRLVPMDDPHAMAQGIRDVLADPPKPEFLRQRARDFGVEQSVNKYLALLFPDER